MIDDIFDDILANLAKIIYLFSDETYDSFTSSIKDDILTPMQSDILKLQQHNENFVSQSEIIKDKLENAQSINLLEILD